MLGFRNFNFTGGQSTRIANAQPTYSFGTPSVSSIDEDNGTTTVTFPITTTNVTNGTSLYPKFILNGVGQYPTPTVDIDGDQVVTIASNAGSATAFALADSTTEGAQTLYCELYSDIGATNLLATSSSITVNDTSIDTLTSVNKVAHKTQTSNASANFVIPTTADAGYDDIMAGDVAVLFDMSGTTTDTTPTGWTSISKATTTSIRTNISYKILASGDLGATIVGMGGFNRKIMIIYRGNIAITSATPTVTGQQGTTGTPTNQSLVGEAGPMVALACYGKTTTTTPTRGWSVGSPTEYTSISTSGIYVKQLITNSGTPSTTTISMTDAGSNTLQSFRIKFA